MLKVCTACNKRTYFTEFVHNIRRGARLDHVFYLPVRVQSACWCHGDFSHLGQDVVPKLWGRCRLAGVAAVPYHWGGHLMLVL